MSLPRIAVDAMGGDEGVQTMISGAALARRRHDKFNFLLVGDEPRIKAALDAHPNLRGASEILHCDGVVTGHEKPTQALRRAKTTSMGLTVNAVKSGAAGAAVSAGNTGALMAMSKLALRTMPGIDRPALAALLPSLGAHDVIMLDLGANTECDARNLVQFAVMGAAYSRIVTGQEEPRVRLLNIGTEETKGTDQLQVAAQQLKAAAKSLALSFDGFIEADKINRGTCDVVVSDGFSGNIALKAIEGAARFVTDLLRNAFTSSLRSKIGFLVSRPATELLKHHLDPNNHNGAVFLGLNGVVVKSHGSATAAGVANAVDVAARLLEDDLTQRIIADLAAIGGKDGVEGRAAAIRSVVTGSGSALPRRAVSNAELAEQVDTSDEWIVERTGIRNRHIAGEGETTATLAADAARRALEAAGVAPADVGLIVLATATPDQTFPATATKVQDLIGCHGGIAFDVAAVCSGFLFALATANSMLKAGMAQRALVIGAETFSRILDWEDRTTCVLFGDGAGAIVLEAREVDAAGFRDGPGVLFNQLHADGAHNELLYVDGGPSTTGTVGKLRMKGREVFRHAVTNLASVLETVLAETGFAVADLDWVVPHQANARILDATARKLGLPAEKVVVTVDRHANTSAASVPLAFDTAVRDGRIKPGDLVMFEAMGGGFTWGASLVRM